MTAAAAAQSNFYSKYNIPIRNLWYLLIYASEQPNLLTSHLQSLEQVLEEDEEQLIELLVSILCDRTMERLQAGLTHQYESTSAILTRVRGKIDLISTYRHMLLDQGRVKCNYDYFTCNIPMYRYVHHALISAIHRPQLISKGLHTTCKHLSAQFQRLGIDTHPPAGYTGTEQSTGMSTIDDATLLAAAYLLLQCLLPFDTRGAIAFPNFNKDETWLRELFEKAIRGFYNTHLNKQVYQVSASNKVLHWKWQDATQDISCLMPRMEADIVISKKDRTKKLIIDTKFTNIITNSNKYHSRSFKPGHIYQIYSYVMSRAEDDQNPTNGMLLYPSIDTTIKEQATIQSHLFSFCTIDLTKTPKEIKQELLDICAFGMS